MDIEREIAELRKSRPELDVLARTTRERDALEFGFAWPGWFVHIMTHDENHMVAESYKGSAPTLDEAWSRARERMLSRRN